LDREWNARDSDHLERVSRCFFPTAIQQIFRNNQIPWLDKLAGFAGAINVSWLGRSHLPKSFEMLFLDHEALAMLLKEETDRGQTGDRPGRGRI
jgi:transcriptional regulator with XRE-family HTH domain